MTQHPDGSVVLALRGGRTVKLRPLTVGENRELRKGRYEIEEHGLSYITEREAAQERIKTSIGDARSDAKMELRRLDIAWIDGNEDRNLGWLRRLVEIAGDGAELPSDEEMPPWLADTVNLSELQSMLTARPGEAPGRP